MNDPTPGGSRPTAPNRAAASETASPRIGCTLHADPAADPDGWHRLFETAAASIYQSPCFMRAAMQTLGERGTPQLLIAHVDEEPVAALPFLRQGRVARLPGGRHANIGNLAMRRDLEPGLRRQVMAAMLSRLAAEGLDLLVLHNVVPDALGLTADVPPGIRRQTEWFFEGTLMADFDALLRERRGRKTRSKLNRKRNRLREAEGFAIRRIRDRDEAAAVIDAFIEQKVARFSRRHVHTGFEDPRFRAFCLRLVECGALVLDVMEANGRPLAIYGGGEAHGRYSAYFSSIDEDSPLIKYGPGEVLLAHIVADACARGLKVLDLGVGEMAYKTAWCERRLPVFTVLVPLTLKGRLMALPRALWLGLRPGIKRLVMRHAWLRRLAEKALARRIG